MSISIRLPDGSIREVESGSSIFDLAKSIGEGLARAALAGKIDGELCDLSTPLDKEASVAIVTYRDPEGPTIFRHTATHIMAMAIQRLYPGAVLEDGPATDTGFFYDIEMPESITPDDFGKIESEMKKIVKEDLPIERKVLGRQEAIDLFKERGEKFKVETIEALDDDATITVYQMGDFVDLCRGPHLPRTGMVKAFKIMSIAGAYRKGDASREQLERFYGVAFPDKRMLKEHLQLLEEAKKRDHRRIGQDLDLFSFHEEGPGFPFFHGKGMVVYNALLDFMRSELAKRDYTEIRTPMILNEDLWHRSGHWDNYRENMYFVKIDERDFAVKPMNCPGGLLVYKDGLHSYRELPLRVAEFGTVHRHELSGVLHGLFRVRCFTQDDAHIFCQPDQLQAEIEGVIDLILYVYKKATFDNVHIELSTRPEKSIGSEEVWEQATDVLEKALKKLGINFQLNPGDGAFYGPKIDFHIKDCLGRSWQCGTIQVDFSMPERFDLNYIGADGEKHRPVMIHRAIFGSIERFLGILIEHTGGDLPLWMAPVQVRVMSLSSDQHDYAGEVADAFKQAGMRAEADIRDEKIGMKIREAELAKIPVMLIVGKKEAEEGSVSIRRRGEGDQGSMKIQDCVALIQRENEE
ncbi:MAG: threonine--tRNA ligase [Candidatus Sumerlaeia bacterium]